MCICIIKGLQDYGAYINIKIFQKITNTAFTNVLPPIIWALHGGFDDNYQNWNFLTAATEWMIYDKFSFAQENIYQYCEVEEEEYF